MFVKNLSTVDFDTIMGCFLEAFANYFVNMPTEKQYYKTRWDIVKVDYQYSYGMFDGEKLVGFMITAIDKRNGKLTAFNAGTGVIPVYRGRKIVKSMYDYALDEFKSIGIEKCTLEVIIENIPAIKAYESVGLTIDKVYKSYRGLIPQVFEEDVEMEEVPLKEVEWEQLPNQAFYSWDNQKESILNSTYQYHQVLQAGQPESFFIIQPETGYLAQHDLLQPKGEGWDRLFAAIYRVSTKVKIPNVDDRLPHKINFLESLSLDNYVNQYEMSMDI